MQKLLKISGFYKVFQIPGFAMFPGKVTTLSLLNKNSIKIGKKRSKFKRIKVVYSTKYNATVKVLNIKIFQNRKQKKCTKIFTLH